VFKLVKFKAFMGNATQKVENSAQNKCVKNVMKTRNSYAYAVVHPNRLYNAKSSPNKTF